eukprot:gene30310-37503_t
MSSSAVYERNDLSTLSNYASVVSTHVNLVWDLNFDTQVISGTAEHTVKVLVEGTKTVDFDSSKINFIGDALVNGVVATVTSSDANAVLGRKISVEIPSEFQTEGATFNVKFTYNITPEATAVQWLAPSATKGVPTPAYLIALAAGNLASRDVSPRVRIWSEPEVIESAFYEFGETELFLSTAESIAGPYVWTRYDVLCLPPSFPYGGMENPCLTFATPTLLAGDRSLADVIAHEIAHSWTGNLVTNATWSHFWLNEGWTMWLERKVTSKVFNNPELALLSSQVQMRLYWKDLCDDITLQ